MEQAALRAILEIHGRSVSRAAAWRLDGTCTYCEPGGSQAGATPLATYRDYLNGSRKKELMHEHVDTAPYCEECAAGYDGRQDWPCRTYEAAARGLGLEVPSG